MPIEFKATVMKVGNGLLVTLPKPICDGFGIQKGDILTIRVKDEIIEIPLDEKKGSTHDREAQKLR